MRWLHKKVLKKFLKISRNNRTVERQKQAEFVKHAKSSAFSILYEDMSLRKLFAVAGVTSVSCRSLWLQLENCLKWISNGYTAHRIGHFSHPAAIISFKISKAYST